MRFTKMHGCGNDYIYVCTVTETVPEEIRPELAVRLSDRHKGIGSDGIIFINPADNADFEMEMYNADGSRSQMCGNGIRCVGKYVYDHRLTDKTDVEILTGAGVKRLSLKVDINKNEVVEATVDMGAPILDSASVPVSVSDELLSKDNKKYETLSKEYGRLTVDVPIEVAGKTWHMTCVSMGNPHCVVFLPENEDLANFDIEAVGPLFENHSVFPNRTNTEFVKIDDKNNVHMRVWERGTGETLACGTGCCATTVACILNGLTDPEVTVHVLGGDIKCSWDKKPESPVIMEGPATTVFEGEIEI